MPSTMASTVSTSTRLRSGSTTAASSPMPTISQSGAAGRRCRSRATSSRSVSVSTVGPTILSGLCRLCGPGGFSLRVVDRSRLPDDGDLDLSRILELVLDAACDVLRQPDGFLVRDLLALDHDADLAPGLQRERLGNALERVGDALELLEALDVRLEDVATCTWTRGGNRVGGLDDHRFERRPVDVHVMRRHGHHHRLALAVLAEEVDAELQVRALHFAIDRLADVVDERGADRDVRVEADLLRHDAGEARDFGGVREHVLAVAGAELQAAHQPQDVGMQIVQPELEGDRGAFLAHLLVGFVLHLLHDLLDAGRVNAAVGDEPLDRLLGDLAAVRIETGEDDRTRRVVDDQVDPGGELEGADVAALASDDAALQVVTREIDH